jgi:hypothetical protein
MRHRHKLAQKAEQQRKLLAGDWSRAPEDSGAVVGKPKRRQQTFLVEGKAPRFRLDKFRHRRSASAKRSRSGGSFLPNAPERIAEAVAQFERLHGTLPESRGTLVAQQRQLVDGNRKAQMFPRGTEELPVPRGMKRVATEKGAFHYNPRQISEQRVRRLSARGRENELLNLGPVTKTEAVQRAIRGEFPLSVVERQGDGTEVRTALGTDRTADRQYRAMVRTKTPGNRIQIEPTQTQLAGRLIDRSREGDTAGLPKSRR